MEKEYRKISELKEWTKNPRSITAEGLERLKKQLIKNKEEQGEWLYKPLIITQGGTVLGGNMRLKALKELKADEVWVSVVKADSVDKMLEIALSDNDRVGQYVYDEMLTLIAEFPAIQWQDYAVDLQEAPLVPELQDVAFLDTLFDRADIDTLKPNKYNYRQHPPEQIDHLMKSIKQNGIYKNIVIAKDSTILDGHAVVEAAKQMGIKIVPVKRLDIEPDSDQALKIVISNNELGRFAEADDRKLTEVLKQIKDHAESGLEGTGFDAQKLANLVMVTRPQSEIENMDTAAEWVGMPEYTEQGDTIKLTVNFKNKEDKITFLKMLKEPASEKVRYIWYPHRDKMDLSSVKFEEGENE